MHDALYDVYLTGDLTPGLTVEVAAARLSQLFKIPPAAMAKLLCGRPQLLKKGINHATAVKYREALQRAGVGVAFRARSGTIDSATPKDKPPTTASERTGPPAADTVHFSLAPAGSDVLNDNERRQPPAPVAQPGQFTLAAPGALLDSLPDDRPRVKVSTEHLSVAPAAGELLTPADRQVPAPAYRLTEGTHWRIEHPAD